MSDHLPRLHVGPLTSEPRWHSSLLTPMSAHHRLHQRLRHKQWLSVASSDSQNFKQLETREALVWVSKWTGQQQRSLLISIAEKFSRDHLKRLSTVLEPVVHRDFVTSSLNRFPSAGIRALYERREKERLALEAALADQAAQAELLLMAPTGLDDMGPNIKSSIPSAVPQHTPRKSSVKQADKIELVNPLANQYNMVLEEVAKQIADWSVKVGLMEVENEESDEDQLVQIVSPLFSLSGPFSQPFYRLTLEERNELAALSPSGVFPDLVIQREDTTVKEKERTYGNIHGYFENTQAPTLLKSRKALQINSLYTWQMDHIRKFVDSISEEKKMQFLCQLIQVCSNNQLSFFSQFIQTKLRDRMDINDLPDKILYKIFLSLDKEDIENAAQVSRRWRFLCRLDQLWMSKCVDLGRQEGLVNILAFFRGEQGEDVTKKKSNEPLLTAYLPPVVLADKPKPTQKESRKISQKKKVSTVQKSSSSKKSQSIKFDESSLPLSSGKGSKRKTTLHELLSQVFPETATMGLEKVRLDSEGDRVRIDWRRAYHYLVKVVADLRFQRSLLLDEDSDDDEAMKKQILNRSKNKRRRKNRNMAAFDSDLDSRPTTSSKTAQKWRPPSSTESGDLVPLETYIDRRPLMKPIIGRLKQFQESEDIALDVRPDLKFLHDDLGKSETKEKLHYKHELLALGERGRVAQVVKPVTICVKLQGHLDAIRCLKFNDRLILTGSMDQSIRMWDTASGRSMHKFYGHKGGVITLDCTQEIFLSGSWDMTAMVWSLSPPFSRITVLYGHTDSVTAVRIGSQYLYTGSYDKTIRIYIRQSFSFLHNISFPSGINGIETEERLLLTSHTDRILRLSSAPQGEFLRDFRGHTAPITCFTMSDQLIISGDIDGSLHFWDRSSANCEAVIDTLSNKAINAVQFFRGNVWTGHEDGTIREWHIGSMTCIRTLVGHKGAVSGLQVTFHRIVSASKDATIRSWTFLKQRSKIRRDEHSKQHQQEQIQAKVIFKNPAPLP